jgi:hypothetical protein
MKLAFSITIQFSAHWKQHLQAQRRERKPHRIGFTCPIHRRVDVFFPELAANPARSSWITGLICASGINYAGIELRWTQATALPPFFVGIQFAAAVAQFVQLLAERLSQVQFTEARPFRTAASEHLFQDDWLKPNLTLNLGLRLKLGTFSTLKSARCRPNNPPLLSGCVAARKKSIPFLSRKFNLAPVRLCLGRVAPWLFGKDKTIIRGGYAIAMILASSIEADVFVSAPASSSSSAPSSGRSVYAFCPSGDAPGQPYRLLFLSRAIHLIRGARANQMAPTSTPLRPALDLRYSAAGWRNALSSPCGHRGLKLFQAAAVVFAQRL